MYCSEKAQGLGGGRWGRKGGEVWSRGMGEEMEGFWGDGDGMGWDMGGGVERVGKRCRSCDWIIRGGLLGYYGGGTTCMYLEYLGERKPSQIFHF